MAVYEPGPEELRLEPPKAPTYGLRYLHRFATYEDARDYENKTGLKAPPFKENKPPKRWVDPAARTMEPWRMRVYDIPYMMSQVPIVIEIGYSAEDAATPNFPPVAGDIAPDGHKIYILPEAAVPIRPLRPNERLRAGFGNTIEVENIDYQTANQRDEGKFTKEDRDMLRQIWNYVIKQ